MIINHFTVEVKVYNPKFSLFLGTTILVSLKILSTMGNE